MNRISRWLLFCFISVGLLSCEEDNSFLFVLHGTYNVESVSITNSVIRMTEAGEIPEVQVISFNGGSVIAQFNQDRSYSMSGNTIITYTNTVNNVEVDRQTRNSVNVNSTYEIIGNEVGIDVFLNDFIDPDIFNANPLTINSLSNDQFTMQLNVDIVNHSDESIIERNFQAEIVLSLLNR